MEATSQIIPQHKWLVFIAVAMGIFLSTIDSSIVNVALPTMADEFHTEFAAVQWVVLGYMLTLATLLLSMGRLSDIIGSKPVYFCGMAIFTAASLLCGLAPGIYWLIGFRVLQAVGASMMVSLGMGILTKTFPPTERGKALGAAGSIVSIGIIAGPTLGGLIIDSLTWQGIFFVNVPVGLLGLFMVARYIPTFKKPFSERFDYWGAASLFVSLASFMMALTLSQKLGFTNVYIIVLFGIWIFFFIFFIFIEMHIAQPMIDLHLFRIVQFRLNLFIGFTSFLSSGGLVVLMPFYLQNVLDYSPAQVGMFMAVIPIAAGIVSPIAGTLSDRFGCRAITTLGLFILSISYIGLIRLTLQSTPWDYVMHLLPIGLGIGIFQSPNNSAIMGTAPREKVGVVSSLLSLTRVLGQSSGIAIIGAFWAHRVAGHLHHHAGSIDLKTARFHGFYDTFIAASCFVTLGLLLSALNWLQEKFGRND